MPTPDLDRFTSRRSTVYATDGIVATSQPLAAQAGTQILRDGGNAFDAAVATAAALNVVEPTSTGLGGDVFALYRTADGDVGAMRSCGWAPDGATIAAVRKAVAAETGADPDSVSMPETGPHPVTIPGTARGWEATVDRFGHLSLADVLDPAITYAMEGYPVTEVIANQWEQGEELFTDSHARDAYLVDGRSPRVGETVRLENLGESLQKIADRGADVVYEGEIAEAIASEVQAKGGFLTVEDLTSFEPEFPDPVSTTYNGVNIFELPPNNQGPIVLEALNIAAELDVDDSLDDPTYRHRLMEAIKLAFHDGHHYITDPKYEDVPPLHDKAYGATRASEVGESALTDVDVGMPNAGSAEDADTVLLTVADGEGNVVSFINSRFKGFGSGLVAGDTGIALQNRGASFSLNPAHSNHLEPGKRPFHTLIPAIARFGADDWAAFGVMGGYMQPQGQVQVLSAIIDRDLPLQAALDRPRCRYREDGTLAIEGTLDGHTATKLARRGHDVRVEPPSVFGGAQIVRNDNGTLSGATEPRKDGIVSGF